MTSARVIINPADNIGQLAVWSTFNLFGSFGNALLLIIGLFIPRIRRNPLLISLHFVVATSSIMWTILVIAGQGMNEHPPFGLCLVSAASGYVLAAATTASALGLVTKIWANVMLIYHPGAPILNAVSWTPVLFIIPYVSIFVLFFVSIAIGLKDHSLVYRGSAFYCTIDNNALNTIAPAIAGLYSLITFVLAAWTAVLVIRTRRRAGTHTANRIRNFQLVIRVLFFSILMLVGLVCGIVAVFLGFAINWVDIVVAFTSVWAFLVFASDRDNLHVLLRCSLPKNTDMSTQHTSVTISKQVHIRREGSSGVADAELVTFPIDAHTEEGRRVAGDKVVEMTGEMYDMALQDLGKGRDANEIWDLKAVR